MDGHYDNEEDDPAMNGWIKKEIEDDEFEDYIRQEPDMESGDRYEELMILNKDDLVGRILQQEEDIRYLQDLRHGLEKNVHDLTSSCGDLKKLVGDLSSVVATLKDPQPVVSSPPPLNQGRSAPLSRSNASTAAAASPRSTPNVFSASSPSQRSNPGMMNTRSAASASANQQPSQIASSIITTDRMHAGGGGVGKTVTITRSTNVVIKTEIPSPPPDEPLMTQQALPAPIPISNQRKPYQRQPQQKMPRNSAAAAQTSSSQMPFSQAPTFGRAGNQAGNIQARQQPQTRGRPSSQQMQFQHIAPARQTNQQMQKNKANVFQQQQRPQQQQQRVAQANVPQQNTAFSASGSKGQNIPFSSAAATRPSAPVLNTQAGMMNRQHPNQQNVSAANSAPAAKSSAAEDSGGSMKMPGGITLPSGLTLSIVTPKLSSDQKAQLGGEKAVISSTMTKSSDNTGACGEDVVPKNSDKNISSSNASNAVSTTSTSALDDEEEEEDGEFFEEVAVLELDKAGSPTPMDVSGGQSSDGQVTSGSSGEGFSRVIEHSTEPYWAGQNTAGRSGHKNTYQNNDEYMYEETGDIDSGDEQDSKIYLGEDVSLPKELVDSCIKQGPTPAKLTRNLMQALFPDLREIASGCNDGGIDGSSGPSLPSNKLNAIIAHVQKVFPQTKRSQIVLTMNMKCREARTQLTKNRRTHVQYSPY